MIIRRYLIKETLKTQIAILFVLLLIFFSQKLIRVLSSAVEGDIPNNLILPILMLGISDIAELILPLSLFLGILVTFGRFYSESEMITMFACGVRKRLLYSVVFILCLLTIIVTAINSVWYGPWSNYQEEQLVENAKLNPSLAGLLAGQFQTSAMGDSVLYISNVDNGRIANIFIAQVNPSKNQRPAIILADKGRIMHDNNGNQIINLDHATRYEGTNSLKDIRISEFNDYQAIIKPKSAEMAEDQQKNDVEQMSFSELQQSKLSKARAEYYWRISLILSVPLMAFLVIPLSETNPRQGKLANVLPALVLYLIYFLLESSIKANAGKGRLDPAFWFYLVNGSYLLLAILLNFWDTLFMRKLRFKLRRSA